MVSTAIRQNVKDIKMNLKFRISRLKTLFYCRKNLISSREDYIAFLKKCADEYKPRTVIVKDETVKCEAAPDLLFRKIPGHRESAKTYGFPYADGLTDRENALAIMAHLTKHTHYCGATRNILPDDGAEISRNSFDLPFEKALNCRSKAIALTDIMNSYGIKALPICTMSNDKGCHFLVQVWLREENRFIVMDPSFNCTFADEDGIELSVFELRERILNDKSVSINGYSVFGTNELKDYYYAAFIGDLMENLSTWKTNVRGRRELSKVCGVEFDARVLKEL